MNWLTTRRPESDKAGHMRIYDFQESGVKVFTGKSGGGNEISEVYIYGVDGVVDQRLTED